MTRLIFTLLCLSLAPSAQAQTPPEPTAGQVIPLWPGNAPGVVQPQPPEFVTKGYQTHNVTAPTLTAYLPPRDKRSGTALIFCPGGGYAHVAINEAGRRQMADAFAPAGIAVFILKYRTHSKAKTYLEDAKTDGERAIRLVRSHAKEWGLDPHRIGLMGVSAGANLTLHVCSGFDTGDPAALDPIARESARPDFACLLACWAFTATTNPYPLTKATPPMFICHAYDDHVAPTALSEDINARLTELGIPVSFNQYTQGGHGAFNLGTALPASHWPELFIPWLEAQGYLKPAAN